MKNKKIIFLLSVLLVVGLVVNSCTKETQQDKIALLFTNGTWQLASVMRYDYVGSSQIDEDTLNTTCSLKQYFTFPTTGTCTYTNFHCVNKSATGTWALTDKGLYLQANIALMDTVSADSCCRVANPFANAQIVSLGNYSMVLKTGDINAYFTATQKRTIYVYGFVRQTSATN